MGGVHRVHLYVRMYLRADVSPFPHLGNGWTDCAEIWCVVSDPLARHFIKVNAGVQVHVRTYALLFRISGTAGWIALTFDVWLLDQQQCVFFWGGGITSGAHCTYARAHHFFISQ